jgi:hypothetical protein
LIAWLQGAKETNTRLSVLTWNPNVGPQVKSSYAEWKKLAKKHPKVIEAKSYSSAPTMQGVIVLDDWALIELIPYRTEPDSRPAIFLSETADPELFKLFQSSFKMLLKNSEPIVD